MDITHLGEKLTVCESALKGSTFEKVDLSAASFSKVKLAGTTMREADLSGLSLHHCDLRDAAISACHTDGMTIDGVRVSDLLAAYRAKGRTP